MLVKATGHRMISPYHILNTLQIIMACSFYVPDWNLADVSDIDPARQGIQWTLGPFS